ncbi:MAG: ABC transporter permease [Calditrichaceae bacterium]|jgi:ABC-2 type transport system permease protein
MTKYFKWLQFRQLFLAHFKELTREPGVLFWGILFPILMALGLGLAFTQKADMEINVAVIPNQNEGSRSLSGTSKIQKFLEEYAKKIPGKNSAPAEYKVVIKDNKLGNNIFYFRKTGWEEGMKLLKRGNLSILIENENGKIKYHFDPHNPTAQLTYLKLSSILKDGAPLKIANTESIEPLTVIGSRYIDFFIPGMIALGIMMSTMWGISYRIIEMRSQKLLRRMVATPMKKSHFMIAMTSVRTIMNFVEGFLLFIFAYFVFDITIQGDISALILIFLAGNLAFGGIAIFISAHTAKTEVGNGLINIVVMPMMVLSGIFFSYHNFPDWAIPVIKKFPLTMLADSIRSIFIEGAGYSEIAVPFLALLIIGVVFLTAGIRIFKWY